jgi:hypothetical protein
MGVLRRILGAIRGYDSRLNAYVVQPRNHAVLGIRAIPKPRRWASRRPKPSSADSGSSENNSATAQHVEWEVLHWQE